MKEILILEETNLCDDAIDMSCGPGECGPVED
jgi:hypothetical protein